MDGFGEFDRPPLIEMVVGIRFLPESGLRLFTLNALVEKWKKSYPRIQEVPPLLEWADPGSAEPFQLTVGHPFRLWFVDDSEHELVQLQADRLLVNWRKLGAGQYPRYPHVKDVLLERLDELNAFLRPNQSESVQVVGAEISYINSVSVNGQAGGALERVLRFWHPGRPGSLGTPDLATCALAYSVPMTRSDTPAQLLVEAKPNRNASGEPTMSLSLTLRGAVKPPASVGAYLDEMHMHITSSFLELTPDEAQLDWGRHQ